MSESRHTTEVSDSESRGSERVLKRVKSRLLSIVAPLSARERIVYGGLIVGFMGLVVVPRVTADVGDVGSLFSVAASQCSSTEAWIGTENISGQPSAGINPERSLLTSSNSALWNGTAGSIECGGYSSVLDHVQINNAIGITLRATAASPDEVILNEADEQLGTTALQDGAILHERIDTRPIVIEPNILGNEQAVTPIDTLVLVSVSADDGDSWIPFHSFDRSITSATDSRYEIALPAQILSDSSTLAVKVETVTNDDAISLYVDSVVWTYEVGENLDVSAKIIDSDTKDVISAELPVLNESSDISVEIGIKDENDGLWQGLGNKATSTLGSDQVDDITVKALLYDANGALINQVEPETQYTETDLSNTDLFESIIDIMPSAADPGTYRLDLEVTQGDGAVQTTSQDFLWGVLALNTDQDTYLPGDSAGIHLTVLDEFGATVCDADVTLNIQGPGTNATYSSNNGIELGETCEVYGSQIDPDYFTSHTFGDAGEYTLSLSATTANGTYEISELITVTDEQPFVISRSGPTRIFPVVNYPMTITVTANQDFIGIVSETVPLDFAISQASFSVDYDAITSSGGSQKIDWNVSLAAGESVELGYQFDAPDISPEFYVLGPASLDTVDANSYTEQRQWQIAGDAIDVFRSTTYELQSGEFTGTTYTLDLNNDLETNYFAMIVGPTIATGSRSPDEDMVRVSGDPFSNLGSTTANPNQIELSRGDAANNWIGTVTVVECIQQCASLGFELAEVLETPLATGAGNAAQTVPDTLAANHTPQTVPIGGIRGGGFSTTGTDANAYSTTGGIKISKINTNELQFDRFGGENRAPAAGTVTTYVVNWGSSWTIQNANVTGTNTGSGLDATGQYNTAAISSVVRANTFVLGGGFTRDDGLGDGAFGQVIALGDGVTQNTNESLVAVGGEGGIIAPGRDFEVFVLENPDLAVEHQFRPRGDQGLSSGYQELTTTVNGPLTTEIYDNTATDIQFTEGSRLTTITTTSGGTGQAYSRTGAWGNRLTADTTFNYFRAYAGQPVTAWAQVVDFGDITFAISEIEQRSYRWRDDSTDLNTSGGWLEAENAPLTDQAKLASVRLRMQIANVQASAEPTARSYEMQFAEKGALSDCSLASTWTGLTDNPSDAFTQFPSTHIDPDGESTTSGLLSNGAGYAYVNGEGRESSDNTGAIGPLGGSEYTELEFTVQLTTNAKAGTNYCFRVFDIANAQPLDTYSAFPELSIAGSSNIIASGLGESGTFASAADGGWTTVNFQSNYTTPVIVGTTNSQNGQNALNFEVQNVLPGSAEMRVCESEGATANGCDTHASETVGYIVIDAAVAAITPGIEAGTLTLSGNEANQQVVTFGTPFSNTPYVFANVQTVNSSEVPIATIIPNTSATNFTASICDHALGSVDACDGAHGNETVGWVAIDPLNAPFSEQYQTGLPSIGNSTWTPVVFSPAFTSNPVVVVSNQTDAGAQDVEIDEARLVTTTGADVRSCEIDTLDNCDTHANDDTAWIAIESGEFGTALDLDQDGYRIYENTDATLPTTPLAAEDTAAIDVDDGDVVRIRLGVQSGSSELPATTLVQTLQYAEAADCSAAAVWTNVGASGSLEIWRGAANPTPADGSTLGSSVLDGGTNVPQSYVEENNTPTNPTAVSAGGRGEWDFVIENNGAAPSTNYCFRSVISGGDEINYTFYPQITTASGIRMLILHDGPSIPSGWSCVSCLVADPFYESFIRGEATFGTTGGSATHTHTASATADPSTDTATQNRNGAILADNTHTHTVSGIAFSAESNLPNYRQLQVLQSDSSASKVDEIPDGGILLFNSATIPTGYVRYSAQDGAYVRGQNVIGAPGGSNTHTHTVTATLDAAAGANDGRRNGGTQVAAATDDHTHPVSGSSSLSNHEPPYIEVVLIQASGATQAIPNGSIAMFNGAAPTDWNCVSCTSGDILYQRFFKPSATFGATAGSATTTNPDFTIVSDAPSATDTSRNQTPNTATGTHTHNVNFTGTSLENTLPPYTDVIFYEANLNTAPNVPVSLDQEKSDTTPIPVDGWTNEGVVTFSSDATDPDNPDSLQLCVEVQLIATPFTDADTACGPLGAYSGAALSVSVDIGSLGDGSSYHWQARVTDASGDSSAWISFGGNLETEADFKIDTSLPAGSVFDGATPLVDVEFNNGSLDSLSANWDINSDISGLSGYEYSIGTTPGAVDTLGWTANGTAPSATATSLNLNTNQPYYFNVRTTDNAGNISTLSSDGIFVAPTLNFTISNTTLDLGTLNGSNGYTSSDTTTLTTSTNAYNGYFIRAFATGLLENIDGATIPLFAGGTYASPDEWLPGDVGYGYTTNDPTVNGVNRFNNTPCPGGGNPSCFAPFSLTAPGDIIVDNTNLTSGTPIVSEGFTVTHRVTSDGLQEFGDYQTTIVYTITARY